MMMTNDEQAIQAIALVCEAKSQQHNINYMRINFSFGLCRINGMRSSFFVCVRCRSGRCTKGRLARGKNSKMMMIIRYIHYALYSFLKTATIWHDKHVIKHSFAIDNLVWYVDALKFGGERQRQGKKKKISEKPCWHTHTQLPQHTKWICINTLRLWYIPKTWILRK